MNIFSIIFKKIQIYQKIFLQNFMIFYAFYNISFSFCFFLFLTFGFYINFSSIALKILLRIIGVQVISSTHIRNSRVRSTSAGFSIRYSEDTNSQCLAHTKSKRNNLFSVSNAITMDSRRMRTRNAFITTIWWKSRNVNKGEALTRVVLRKSATDGRIFRKERRTIYNP